MDNTIFEEDYENMSEKEIEDIESKITGIMKRAENTVEAFAKNGKYSFRDAMFYASCIVAITAVETGCNLDNKNGGGAEFNTDIVYQCINSTSKELIEQFLEPDDE